MWYEIVMFLFGCVMLYILWTITDRTHNKPNKIRFYYNLIIFYLACMISSFIILPICIARPMNVLNAKFGCLTIKYITNIFIKDLKWDLRNGEILAEDRGAVIIANHQSTFDILGMACIWDTVHKLSVVAKKELFYFWPFGLSAYLSGIVFINRNKKKDTYKQFEETSKIMTKNKVKVWIFPEGTRNKSDANMLPFKKGAFNIAVAAQVPIIPIVYSPYYFIDAKKHIFNYGTIQIKCLKPISTEGLTMEDVPELAKRLQKIMSDAYDELSKEVLDALPEGYFS